MIRYRGYKIDRRARTISDGVVTCQFGPQQFTVAAALVLGGPHTCRQLVALLFSDREDGGPDDAARCVWTLVAQANERLRLAGFSFKLARLHPCSFLYEMVGL